MEQSLGQDPADSPVCRRDLIIRWKCGTAESQVRPVRIWGSSAWLAGPCSPATRGDYHHSIHAGLESERLESRNFEVYSGFTGWFSTRLTF